MKRNVRDFMGALPVLVEGSIAACARVQEVGQKLGEAHVVAAGQRVWAWARPQAPHRNSTSCWKHSVDTINTTQKRISQDPQVKLFEEHKKISSAGT